MSAREDLLLFTVAFKIEGQPMNDHPTVIGRIPLKLSFDSEEVAWSITLFPFDPVVAIGSWQLGLVQVVREATSGWHLGMALDLMSGGQWVGPVGHRVGCCVLLEQTLMPPSVMSEDWHDWRQKWDKIAEGG